MATSSPKLLVCYSLGAGAGLDLSLASLGRQLCEDFAELLALNEGFVTVPQMVVVREAEDLIYSPDKNACAFAVFYSLPETQWILQATRAIGGDMALTGRIVDDESGLLLSINIIDANSRDLLFCGCETCARDEIHLALQKIATRILYQFTQVPVAFWQPKVQEMLGTTQYHAYANWMNMREAERRAQREGLPAPYSRIVEHLTYALNADPQYSRAGLKLCEILANQLPRQSYEFILRYLEPNYNQNEALSLIIVQCLARLGRRMDAENMLNHIIEKRPSNGLFRLMRGCLRSDERLASRDLEDAKAMLGNDFNGCRSAVDNALLNVTGV